MKTAYGITSFEVGDIAAADGTLENPVDVTTAVYKDTIELNVPEPTETTHRVEGKKAPIVVTDEAGLTTVMLSLADTSAAQKLAFMGGTITTLDFKDTWNAPAENTVIEKYIRFTTKDGMVFQCPRVKVNARLTGKIAESGIVLMPIKMTVLAPNFAALKEMMVTDPA